MFLTGTSINIYSQIGLVMLIGIMGKNDILLVEFADPLAGLEHGNRSALLDQTVSCRQTGNAGPDNDDIDILGDTHDGLQPGRRRSWRYLLAFIGRHACRQRAFPLGLDAKTRILCSGTLVGTIMVLH